VSHALLRIVATQEAVTTKELPGVDIGRHRKKVGERRSGNLGPLEKFESEYLLHPIAMQLLCRRCDTSDALVGVLLTEERDRPVAAKLAVIDNRIQRCPYISNRGHTLFGHLLPSELDDGVE